MSEDRPQWLSDSFEASRRMSDLGYEMRVIARAFANTGNSDMAQRIGFWAEEAEASAKLSSGAMSESITDSLRASEKATGNMLLALMAGASIKGSDEDRAAIAAIAERHAGSDKAPSDGDSNG